MHTSYIKVDDAGHTHTTPLQHDYKGGLQVALDMRRSVRSHAGLDHNQVDRGLQRHARRVVDAANVAGHDWRGEVKAIHNYVRDQITYRSDPAGGTDVFQEPRYTLQIGEGDCADLVALEASMLALLGYQCDFVLAEYPNQPVPGFSHVYLRVHTPTGRRAALDPTAWKNKAGFEVPGALRRVAVPIFQEGLQELSGIKSILGKVGKIAAGVAASSGIPGISQAGQAASMAFEQFGGAGGAAKAAKLGDADIADQLRKATDGLRSGEVKTTSDVRAAADTLMRTKGGGPQTVAAASEFNQAWDEAKANPKGTASNPQYIPPGAKTPADGVAQSQALSLFGGGQSSLIFLGFGALILVLILSGRGQ